MDATEPREAGLAGASLFHYGSEYVIALGHTYSKSYYRSKEVQKESEQAPSRRAESNR